MAAEKMINHTKLILSQGDITRADEEAIVNAANSALAGGGGVDGAIHRAGGPEIMAEGRAIGHCPTGEAVITTAGKLKAKKVIHTVGPVYRGRPEDPRLLASAYKNSLALAAKNKLKSVAFPSLSTGAYGYPVDQAAKVALKAVKEGIEAHPGAFERVHFVLFGDDAYDAYCRALDGVY
ncbi:MAG: O-acetyl-ADP-ribose deacetylase [Desulfarculaceae bacterium]|nr:O-acetyl-ADP-ribose deacetylase [Desulfarculaceae bacterium]MCF8072367.1 O-acetyl-ADP-ribose deacetylase [Desulfarculaceae bacterium]MCF8100288.1 O-acetyl-ADP-ribose deacetylase [Desulfarculaceae bacterium]MCF8116139.1 O-acetyl-ADP-ribose deacetylase [Desulfarculaceae bacterium]